MGACNSAKPTHLPINGDKKTLLPPQPKVKLEAKVGASTKPDSMAAGGEIKDDGKNGKGQDNEGQNPHVRDNNFPHQPESARLVECQNPEDGPDQEERRSIDTSPIQPRPEHNEEERKVAHAGLDGLDSEEQHSSEHSSEYSSEHSEHSEHSESIKSIDDCLFEHIFEEI